MSNPNYPEGVSERDIDRTCGETMDEKDLKIESLKKTLSKIKHRLENNPDYHPAGCAAWELTGNYSRSIFISYRECDCSIGDCLNDIEMVDYE